MKHKKVAGVGIYIPGKFKAVVNGISIKEYQVWKHMLYRCKADTAERLRRPSYDGCSIHPDFIEFQNFAEWCQHQVGFINDGWQLDKDILHPGNKVYGPDTCCFVPRSINLLLIHSRSDVGEYPTGVCRRGNRFVAFISIEGRRKFLGYHDTPETAYLTYKIAKEAEIKRQAEIYRLVIDNRVYKALIQYKVNS